MEPRFRIIFLKEVKDFLATLPDKVRIKITSNARKATLVLDSELFKKLGDTKIWEFRTKFSGMEYRLLAFWDETQHAMVVATHGFIKKSQKTPLREIEKAKNIMNEYYNNKKKENGK